MASGVIKERELVLQNIRGGVTCSICSEVLTGPKTIPCMHMLCKVCIENNSTDKCPGGIHSSFCHAKVSQDDIDMIPTNYNNSKHLEISQQGVDFAGHKVLTGNGCGKCKEDSPVIMWCRECETFLCYDCNKIHSKWEQFKSHKAVSIDVFIQQVYEMGSGKVNNCSNHDRPLNIHCKTCDSIFCHVCILKDHCKHSFIVAENTLVAEPTSNIDIKSRKGTTAPIPKLTKITKKTSKTTKKTSKTHHPPDHEDSLLRESIKKENNITSNEHNDTVNGKPSTELHYPVFISKYNYSARTDEDLSFKKGDLLYIIRDDDDGWWLARTKDSIQQGYIPSSYVKEYKSPLDAEDWYFRTISYLHGENLLMQLPNGDGSFLVCNSRRSKGYTLLLRDVQTVKMYKINTTEDETYYISKQKSFQTLSQLVSFYSQLVTGLPVKLKSPCVVAEELRTNGLSKNVNKIWRIERITLVFHKQLGKGQFGEVWGAVWNKTTPVAVKILKPGIITIADFLKEAAVLKNLWHRNVLQLRAVCTQGEPIYIITELMKQGNLLNYLCGFGRNLKLPQLVNMGAQVAAGMDYLEKNSFIHGNIAARNILLSDHLVCKIGCFSVINTVCKYVKYTKIKFAVKWAAPEVLRFAHFTIKSDVWSFGILLYELITYGSDPYPGIDSDTAKELVLKNGYRMSRPRNCPENLYKIMIKCWHNDASCRPTFETLQWQLEDYFVDQGLYAATVSTPCFLVEQPIKHAQ